MHVLASNFNLLQFCGLWRPYKWSSGWKKNLYDAYTIFVIFSVYTFTLSELIEVSIFIENFDDAVNIIFMAITMLGVCYKVGNIIFKRNEIMILLEILNNDRCCPIEDKEIRIQMKHDKRCSTNTLLFCGLVEGAVVAVTIGSFFGNIPNRTLPFKAWLPFNYSSDLGYWIGYFHQIWSHALAATIAGAHDTIFHGFMIQACSQLNILKSRLHSIPDVVAYKKSVIGLESREKQKIRMCVQHHLEICKFVELSNEIFNIVIFIQCSVSTFVICVSTYMLSKVNFLSAGFTFIIVYLGCMITQIFLLCFHGNEVITESMDVSNAIYDMDWDLLNLNTQKDLCLMMTRTHRRLKYTSGFITLSLESYNSLMKFTYSIYNLLQQTST